MARKKRRHRQLPPPPPPPPKPEPGPPLYAVGQKLRVKRGTPDPDFSDIPLGGWVGIVKELDVDDAENIYELELTPETLAAVPDVYESRCERAGIAHDTIRLAESALEPDPGGPVNLEQPTRLVPLPLDHEEPEDQVRLIFGLTSDDPLPEMDEEALAHFHLYLTNVLRLPTAVLLPGGQPGRLIRIVHPEEDFHPYGLIAEVADADNERRRLPLVDLELPTNNPLGVVLFQYQTWVESCGVLEGLPAGIAFPWTFRQLLLFACIFFGLAGAAFGSLIQTLEGTVFAAKIGGGILGAIVALVGWMFGRFLGRVRPGGGRIGGGILGALVGGFVGAYLGCLVVGFLGSLPGAVVGTLLVGLLRRSGKHPNTLVITLTGAAIGGLILAFLTDANNAWPGALVGLVAFPIIGFVLMAFVVGFLAFPPPRSD